MHRWLQRHRRLMLSLGVCAAFVFLVRAGIGQYQAFVVDSSSFSTSAKLAECGDGIREYGEQCDDGNGVEGDGCSIGCITEYCGDNLAHPLLGEECDGDNFAPDVVQYEGIMCGNDCKVGSCGVDDPPPPEWGNPPTSWSGARMYHLCDNSCSEVFIPRSYVLQWRDYFSAQNGFFFSQSHCECLANSGIYEEFWTCQGVGGTCGDGTVDDGEECDDSNTDDGDGCSAACVTEVPVCGNGRLEGDEQCDPPEGSPEWYDGEPDFQPLDRSWCEKDICELNDCSNGKDDDGDGDIDDGDAGCYGNEDVGAIGFWERWWRTLTAQVAPNVVFVPGKGFEDQCPMGHVYNKATKMCDPTQCPVPPEGRDNIGAVTTACRSDATDDPQCKCVPGKPTVNDYDHDGACDPDDRTFCVEWLVASCVCDCRNGTGAAATTCYEDCENDGGGACDVVVGTPAQCRAYAITQHCPAPADEDHGNGAGPGAGFGMGGMGPIFPPLGGDDGGDAADGGDGDDDDGGDDGDGGNDGATSSVSSVTPSSSRASSSSRSSSRSSAPSSPSSSRSSSLSSSLRSSSPSSRSFSSSPQCPTGQTCQNVTVCRDSGGRFGNACNPSAPDTVCCIPASSSSSVFVGCGDGKWNFVGLNNTWDDGKGDDEQCDDGNKVGGDGCGPSCKFEECYNGVIDAAGPDKIPGNKDDEECDDGGWERGDGCNEWCKVERCGNGIIDYNEECDNGDKNSDTVAHACRTNCMVARCGDGTVDDINGSPSGYPEQCDCGLGFAPGDETNSDYECIQTQADGVQYKCTYYCMALYCYQEPKAYMLHANYYPCLNGKLKDGTPCDACMASSQSSSSSSQSSSSSRSTGGSQPPTSSRRSSSSVRTGGNNGPGGGPGGSQPTQSSAPGICQLYPWVCVPPSSAPTVCQLYPWVCTPPSSARSVDGCALYNICPSSRRSSSVRSSSSIPTACVPGTVCPNGALCPANGRCPSISSAPSSTSRSSSVRSFPSSPPLLCRSGTVCPDGTPCPPSGICPPRSSSRISVTFSQSSPNRCFTNAQCPAGQLCFNGICAPFPSSASLRSSRQSSVTVVFVPSSARTATSSAPAGQLGGVTATTGGVIGGNTGGTTGLCRSSLDCPGGTRCVDGSCTPFQEGSETGGALGGNPLTAQLPDRTDVLAALALCGNGSLDSGEECEDGNARDFDGCSADCLMERGICGDGTVQTLLGEQCEPSTHDPALPYACSGHCRFFSSLCGNGVTDPGEECDLAAANSDAPGASCRTTCSLARCGDGVVDVPFETCDDGNRVGADGCGRQCQEERGAPVSETAGSIFQLPVTPVGPYVPAYTTSQTAMIPAHAPIGDTGPASVAVMAAGAAAGVGWSRRRKHRLASAKRP